MKKTLFFFIFVALSTLLFAESKKTKLPKVNFENEPTGKLSVYNETDADLVLFAGSPDFDIFLGGVRARSSKNVDLSKIKMPKQGCFLLRAATLDRFNQKQGLLVKGDNNNLFDINAKIRTIEGDFIYTALVVFSDVEIYKVTIPKFIDVEKKYSFFATNLSKQFVLELREGTPARGENVVASIPPMTRHEEIYLLPRDDGLWYEIYPVFIYVNPDGVKEKAELFAGRNSRARFEPEPMDGKIVSCEFSDSDMEYDHSKIKKPMRLFFE